ncbi:MAG: hypothetical protein V2B19_31110 [Pseudomonadota bacterium]
MNDNNSIVATYPLHTAAEDATRELLQSGFDMKKLSIVGCDYHIDERVVGYYNVGNRMIVLDKTGTFWGGMWGLFFGSAFFWMPGLGPLLVAGPLVNWIVEAIEGAIVVGSLSAIGVGLYRLGIPRYRILRHEMALKAGKFLLIAHGSTDDTIHANEILNRTQLETLERYQR